MGELRHLRRRPSAADNVREAVRLLYCEGPDDYFRYRDADAASPEQSAWREVDAFVRASENPERQVIDLGCGAGHAALRVWQFRHYLGIDISAAMIARHTLLNDARATFLTADLEEISYEAAVSVSSPPCEILAVLSLHYLSDLKRTIAPYRRAGNRFCFIVANAFYDIPNTDEEGLVQRRKGNFNLKYLSHYLASYIDALGAAQSVQVRQCGGEHDESGNQPYWFIGGEW